MADVAARAHDKRLACALPGTVRVGGGVFEGTVLELSYFGGRIECAAPIEYGTVFDLSFELPGGPVWVACLALHPREEGRAFRYYLTVPDDKQRIDRFVGAGPAAEP